MGEAPLTPRKGELPSLEEPLADDESPWVTLITQVDMAGTATGLTADERYPHLDVPPERGACGALMSSMDSTRMTGTSMLWRAVAPILVRLRARMVVGDDPDSHSALSSDLLLLPCRPALDMHILSNLSKVTSRLRGLFMPLLSFRTSPTDTPACVER